MPRVPHQNKNRCSKCSDSALIESFQCTAKSFSVKTCHKIGHFTSKCYQKKQGGPRCTSYTQAQYMPKTVPFADDSSSDDSFCLQVKVKPTQANFQRISRPTHLITDLAYRLKPYHARNLYLRAGLDTCVDINIMPAIVYKLVFQDLSMKKLAPSSLEIASHTTDTVKIVGSCMFYLVHPDTKKLMDVTFFVSVNDGSVLLPCKTTLMLGLIQPGTRLDYLPPRASLITSFTGHPKRTKWTLSVQKQEVPTQTVTQQVAAQMPKHKYAAPRLITSKDQILCEYPDVFKGIGRLLGPSYQIQVDPSVTPKQTPCHPVPPHLKEAFTQEVDKMLQAGVLKPGHEATPWINSFVLVESKDKLGNLKLCIILDPTNLNKVDYKRAIPLQNTWRYCPFTWQCLHYDCM